MPEEIRITFGDERYKITISAVLTSDGISATITGGEKPHVGGAAVSTPRKSLAGDRISCDTWVCPVPGHKDTEVAVPIAEMICRETGQPVVVVAGIHIDRAEEREIAILVDNSREAAMLLLAQIKG